MLGLVRRKRLEETEAETRTLLAHFTEAVAAAQQAVAGHQETMARYNELLRIVNDWQKSYAEQAAELKRARDARDLAWWTIRVPGMENIGPPTCIGEYIEGGH
jgi:multidrug resistance efflux pump